MCIRDSSKIVVINMIVEDLWLSKRYSASLEKINTENIIPVNKGNINASFNFFKFIFLNERKELIK